MFSYVDAKIRQRLLGSGRLITLNMNGEAVPNDSEGGPFVTLLGPIPMPIHVAGNETLFHWYPFVRRVELSSVLRSAEAVPGGGQEAFRSLLQEHMAVNSLIVKPGFPGEGMPLVRIHSCCMTGDVFGSMRCECGPQLQSAFEVIAKEGGAVVYMSGHEGRGIGLWAKAVTYLLQDEGQDTYQANVSLGLPEDSRDFTDGAVVLRHFLKGRPLKLMSNNPEKRRQLEENGQPVDSTVVHLAGVSEYNLRYLKAKKDKGHNLPDL